jgi:hypothetical protein
LQQSLLGGISTCLVWRHLSKPWGRGKRRLKKMSIYDRADIVRGHQFLNREKNKLKMNLYLAATLSVV